MRFILQLGSAQLSLVALLSFSLLFIRSSLLLSEDSLSLYCSISLVLVLLVVDGENDNFQLSKTNFHPINTKKKKKKKKLGAHERSEYFFLFFNSSGSSGGSII